MSHCMRHVSARLQVSSATSTLMVLFMSSATVGQFVVFGMLDMKYALFFMVAGVVGAIVGTKV